MFSNLYQEPAQVLQQAVMSIRQFFKELFQVTFLLHVISRNVSWEKEEKKKHMYIVFSIAAILITWVRKQWDLNSLLLLLRDTQQLSFPQGTCMFFPRLTLVTKGNISFLPLCHNLFPEQIEQLLAVS